MIEISIVDNTKLALEVTEDYFRKIINERNNIKNYKMVILSLHNALELTFKFMISSRNSFMVYSMQDSNSYQKVIKRFKEIRGSKNSYLIDCDPYTDTLHTVTFRTAYEILAYLYQVEEFDDKFLFQLKKLENLRNALTHFSAAIEETDILMLYGLFSKCAKLFNDEIKKQDEFINVIHENYTCYKIDNGLCIEFSRTIEEIHMEALDKDIVKVLVKCLIASLGTINDDIELNNYQNLCDFFKTNALDPLKNIYKSNELNHLISFDDFIISGIYILLDSDFLINKTYYDSFGVDVLGGISLSSYCKDLILKKWSSDEKTICSNLNISKKDFNELLQMDKPIDEYCDF